MAGKCNIIIIAMLLLSVSLISGANPSFGTFKKSNDVDLKQVCFINGTICDVCNISSIDYPNGTSAVEDIEMTKRSADFFYQFNQSEPLGYYKVNGYCTYGDDVTKPFTAVFEVTISGANKIGEGAGMTLLGSLIVMILVSAFFFILSWRLNSPLAKFSFVIIASVMLLIVIFYSMVMVQQNLGDFENIVSGYSTFFFVLKIIAGVSFTAFMIFAILVSIRAYKFKRGLID